jgi:hypothetical protein
VSEADLEVLVRFFVIYFIFSYSIPESQIREAELSKKDADKLMRENKNSLEAALRALVK